MTPRAQPDPCRHATLRGKAGAPVGPPGTLRPLPPLPLGRWLAFALGLLLAACGGGGGDGPRVLAQPQQLAFDLALPLVVGDGATVHASASSGLAARYRSLSPTVCSIDETSGRVQALARGVCELAADQAGNADWAPAPRVVLALQVSGQAQQIQLAALPALQVGDQLALASVLQPQASSGLPVLLESSTPAVCTVDAAQQLQALATGRCVLQARQDGDTTWAPAPMAAADAEVALRPQTLQWPALAELTVGSSAALAASSSAGLALRYTSLSPAVCAVDASGAQLLALAAGRCTVQADQPGDAVHAAASLQQVLAVVPRAQAIRTAGTASLVVGQAGMLSASAESALAVSWASLSPSVCSIDASSGQVQGLAVGRCSLRASQAGDARWAAASVDVALEIAINTVHTLRFVAVPALSAQGTGLVQAQASSGLAVRYGSRTPAVCSVDAASGLVNALVAGTCTLTADQPGNAAWVPATQAVLDVAVAARGQTVAFGAAPALVAGGSGTVRAVASSGLAVAYASQSPALCSVDATSGTVQALAAGRCSLRASQAGDAVWAAATPVDQAIEIAVNPVQTLAFGAAPVLTLGGSATVRASASSGLAPVYGSLTPAVCSVQAASGLVSALALGDCRISADQPGNASYLPAARVVQALAVQLPAGATVPGVPTGVTARLDGRPDRVLLSASGVAGGGLPITQYTVESQPAGLVASAASLPISLACNGPCAGLRFTLRAANAMGSGSASAPVNVVSVFDVLAVFREPDTQPRDTIFQGSVTLDSSTGSWSGLAGTLSESMSGSLAGAPPLYDMTLVTLAHQLVSQRDAAAGLTLVGSFARPVTSTFFVVGGSDGWSPAAGIAAGGVYAGLPAPHAGTVRNSSVLLPLPDDPFSPLSAAQVARMAYADCAAGGMMGAVCMTGTSVAAHGRVGTMSGFPLSLVLTQRR